VRYLWNKIAGEGIIKHLSRHSPSKCGWASHKNRLHDGEPQHGFGKWIKEAARRPRLDLDPDSLKSCPVPWGGVKAGQWRGSPLFVPALCSLVWDGNSKILTKRSTTLSPHPPRHWLWVNPQAFLCLPCVFL